MKATEVLSSKKWRQDLKSRKYMGLFLIPRKVFESEKVNDGTKRFVKIVFSTGQRLQGTVSITSGREMYIPKHLHHYFEEASWFDCEIVNDTLYEKSNLDIY